MGSARPGAFTAGPPGDAGRPSSARVYSYLHGGGDWYGPDRDLAETLAGIYPGVRRMAAANRVYLQHAVLYATAHLGIRQFLDLGCGFPAEGSVRDHAQAAAEGTTVACVDWDPVVAGPDGAGPLLEQAGAAGVSVVLADARDPDAVLAHPGVRGVTSLARPVCVVLGCVAHYWPPAQAREILAGYMSALTPGSCAVITVAHNRDGEMFARLQDAWQQGTGTDLHSYTAADVEAVLGGLEIRPPGVGPVSRCRPGWAAGKAPGEAYVIGAIAVKGLPKRRNKRPVSRWPAVLQPRAQGDPPGGEGAFRFRRITLVPDAGTVLYRDA